MIVAGGRWVQTWGLVDALGEARKACLEEAEHLSNESDALAAAIARLALAPGVHASKSAPNLQPQAALGAPSSLQRSGMY